ncbi:MULTISPECIES: hypothetical protein [Citrobacter]|uniref:hypothetical protein n=1 Tax=Citrobacter TaxID=544 RepID=UPI0018AB4B21|nr:hypothetical protein [Citrobacter farmeri]MDB2181906.1 hypothetical protein [Citrobacter farmeri]HBU6573966.1 hypothetical protein [Citrobacter amalonaticus]
MDQLLQYATNRIIELENLLLVDVEVANQLVVYDCKVRAIRIQEARPDPQIKQ